MELRDPALAIALVSFWAALPALLLLARELAWLAWRGVGRATAPHRRIRRATPLASGIAMLILLLGLAAAVLGGASAAIDSFAYHALGSARVVPLVRFWIFFTDIGSGGAVFAVALVATLLLWAHGRRALVAPLWLTWTGTKATVWTVKYLLALPRPAFVTEVTAVSPTFPSDHAAGAMAMYGFVAAVASRTLETPRARYEALWWAAALILAVGFSRIFLGVHYLSDVVGGYLIGALWLLVGLAVAHRRGDAAAAASS